MAEETSGAKKSPIHIKAASWLLGIISRAGLPRQILLGAAVILFLIFSIILCSGTDYRDDPAALAPPSASLFAETRDITQLLKNVGTWSLWKSDRRATPDRVQQSFADRIGELVPGLGSTLPFSWLTKAQKAAISIADGDKEGEKTWALYLQIPDAAEALNQVKREPRLKLEPLRGVNEGLHELSGESGSKVVVGATGPWLIISDQAKLPAFAFEVIRRPNNSLASSQMLPEWTRTVTVRGIADPVYLYSREDTSALFSGLKNWIEPKARLVFTSRLDGENGMDYKLSVTELQAQSGGSGAWPLVKFILFLLAVALLLLIFATLAMIAGWGGWLKAAAKRAGIVPAPAPADVVTSTAFREDAGVPTPTPVTPVVPLQKSAPAEAQKHGEGKD